MSYQSWLDAWNAYKDSKQPVWQYISEHGWDAKTWSWLVPSAAMALLILAVVVCLAGGAIHKLRVKRAPVEQHADVVLKKKGDNIPWTLWAIALIFPMLVVMISATGMGYGPVFIQTGTEPVSFMQYIEQATGGRNLTCTQETDWGTSTMSTNGYYVPDTGFYQCNAILKDGSTPNLTLHVDQDVREFSLTNAANGQSVLHDACPSARH